MWFLQCSSQHHRWAKNTRCQDFHFALLHPIPSPASLWSSAYSILVAGQVNQSQNYVSRNVISSALARHVFHFFFVAFRFDSSQIFRCCCAVVDSWKARPGFVEPNTCWNSIAMKLRIEIIWFVGFCRVELRRIKLDYEMPQIGNNMMMPYDVCLVGFVCIGKLN